MQRGDARHDGQAQPVAGLPRAQHPEEALTEARPLGSG